MNHIESWKVKDIEWFDYIFIMMACAAAIIFCATFLITVVGLVSV
jgi:hypothetical protein